MSGIEKIIDSITKEAELSAKNILAEADLECKGILDAAREKADGICAEMLENANKQYESQIERAKSSAEFIKNQNLLVRKREIIDEFIKEAEKNFLSLPDAEYFSYMQKMVDENSSGSAVLVFNSKDKARLPKTFDLKGNTISEADGDFNGGFIMDFGDVEINCTVSALFEDAYDRLSDIVNSILFRGV